MTVRNKIKALYDLSHSKNYRSIDELQVNSDSHKHYCSILKKITLGFQHKISVLDLGCGTGRYFYCLKNVERLVGIDISPFMLQYARNPLKKEKIEVNTLIFLICADIFEVDFLCSFDFIYSIGVLGEYSPFDLHICNKLFDWLKPKGILFFTVVDIASRPPSKKRRVMKFAYSCPLLSSMFKNKRDDRWESCYMTETELRGIMENSKFVNYQISRYISTSHWKGAHYECVAIKDTEALSKGYV